GVAVGAWEGGGRSRRYRGEPASGASLTLLAHASDAAQAVHQAEVLADAVALVRDLVNTAPSDLVPATFAARAEQVAADNGLSVTVLDEKALAEGGYGGILGRGQGAVRPPRAGRPGVGAPAGAGPAGVRARRGVQVAGAGRKGDHLRLRRAVAQARQVHGGDEVGHGRRGRGAWRNTGHRGPAPAGAGGRLPA